MGARPAVHDVFYSFPEYVRLEQDSSIKHEYLAGQIYAMAGGTAKHAMLAAVITGELMAALRSGRCRVYSSDMRVRVRKTGLSTYPDVTVVCGPRKSDPEDENSATNPVVLVEVTSKSTEQYDRSGKFDHYKQIPSLREYVLVSQSEPAIEVRRRTRKGWTSHVARLGEQAVLRSMDANVTLDVDAVYRAATDVAPERTRRPRAADHPRTPRKVASQRRAR